MRRFILKLKRRRQLHKELEAELAFHREMAAEHGDSVPFGNSASIKEQALDLWRFQFAENLWRDTVYAARGLSRNPALVFTALLSLALGIGANTAIFSLGTNLLLSDPTVRDPGSIVSVRLGGNSHRKEEVVDFVRDSGLFQDVVGENEEAYINWNDGAETHQIFSVFTTRNYFTSLGVPMAYGRGYGPNDPKDVVVLQHRFWMKHFAGDPSIIGRTINLDGRPYTVMGVLKPGHRSLLGFGFSPDVFVPRFLDDTVLAIYGRLKPGMSLREARAGILTVAARLDKAMPSEFKFVDNCRVAPVAGLAHVQEEPEILIIGIFFALLLAVVGLVLLIACVNVASLLLARASVRRREIAIRLALGASRARLVQQLLVESLLLAIMGAVGGLALCQGIATVLGGLRLPVPIPIRIDMPLDWRVGLYAALVTVAATIACGLLPAWQSVRESIAPDFHRETKLRLRRGLVTAQVAISMIVLTTAFLFLRNLVQANSISPGFDVTHTLRAEVNLPPKEYKDEASMKLYVAQGVRSLQAIPGIEAAAAARIIPFTDSTRFGSDLTFPDKGEKVRVLFNWNAITPDYFKVMHIPIRRGRTFTGTDRGGNMVVIVNRTFVEMYLGQREAVGTVFLWGPKGETPYQIVGVVEGTKNLSIGEDPRPQLYEPLWQIHNDRPRIQFVMRSATPPALQLDAVRRVLRALEPAAGTEVSTLYSSIGLAFLPSQVGAVLVGSIGLLALVLAAIGLYGVMVYSVARRTREIGVRMALGAQRAEISRMVVLDSVKLIAWGGSIGALIGIFVTRPLALFLVPGLKPSDPLSFLAVILTLLATGLAASWSPARKAMSVDPMTALRYE